MILIESQLAQDGESMVLWNPITGNVCDESSLKTTILISENNQALCENYLGDALRVEPPAAPRPLDYYIGNVNIVDYDWHLVQLPASEEPIHRDE